MRRLLWWLAVAGRIVVGIGYLSIIATELVIAFLTFVGLPPLYFLISLPVAFLLGWQFNSTTEVLREFMKRSKNS